MKFGLTILKLSVLTAFVLAQITEAASEFKIINPNLRADGSFAFQVNSTQQFKVWIESSEDLIEWTGEALRIPNAAVVLTNRNGPGSHRFYRASEFTLKASGTVRDIQTDVPIAGAKVTLSGLYENTIVQTDTQGAFEALLSGEFPLRKIIVEKAGYEVLSAMPGAAPGSSAFQTTLWLAPPGYRPPNDDFQNRSHLEGTNITVHARTFAATSEPGHDLYVAFDDYGVFYRRNLWWTWTAPEDGALRIETDPFSGIVVYSGQSLQELVRIWDTSNPDNSFFVKEGVRYQIHFGTEWPADTDFTLRMVEPVPPIRVGAWVGDALVSGSPVRAVGEAIYLSVRADGTSPLTYQWRKDGVDIPSATNLLYFKPDIEIEDAGVYTVSVTNQAGTAISNEILITVLSERPQRPELLQGTWIKETSQGPLLITFSDLNFTARWATDNSSAGSGHFRFSESGTPGGFRLIMTYTNPLPEVVHYAWVWLTSANTGSYHDTGPGWYPGADYDSGSFTRAPQ